MNQGADSKSGAQAAAGAPQATAASAQPRLWGGRQGGSLDPAFEAFNRSLPFDLRLVFEDLAGSAAWARALGRAGVLSAEEVTALEAALTTLGDDVRRDPSLLSRSSAEDVHAFVEDTLRERVGDLAKKLHTGRSRNDQVATDLKLHLKGQIIRIGGDLGELMRALVALAEATAALPLPGYTHLQRAQPVTAGHHALAYVEMLARDATRLADASRRMDTSPLGSGALAGTAWPVDREALAADMGFAGGPTRNSLDAVSDRDHAFEVVFACSTIMVHLSRLAEDWIFFATQEAGFLRLGDDVCTGSSLMPQKRNPDALELVRGKCARVIGDLTTLLTLAKGLPLAYDKDLQEDKEALFDALDTTSACLRVTAACVRSARYNEDRCRAAVQGGFLDATDLADLLVRAGVTFRDAHHRVGSAVRLAEELGCELPALPLAKRRELFPELAGDLAADLSVEAMLGRRACTGGTAPDRVRAEVARWNSLFTSTT
ncbi:MAG: argininosuccinate lyase [Planctomycetota bacterium]